MVEPAWFYLSLLRLFLQDTAFYIAYKFNKRLTRSNRLTFALLNHRKDIILWFFLEIHRRVEIKNFSRQRSNLIWVMQLFANTYELWKSSVKPAKSVSTFSEFSGRSNEYGRSGGMIRRRTRCVRPDSAQRRHGLQSLVCTWRDLKAIGKNTLYHSAWP